MHLPNTFALFSTAGRRPRTYTGDATYVCFIGYPAARFSAIALPRTCNRRAMHLPLPNTHFPLQHITPPILPIGERRIPLRPFPRLAYLAATCAPRCISVRYRWYRRGMKASRRRGFLRATMQMAS